MRMFVLLASVSVLAACGGSGGGGVASLGSNAGSGPTGSVAPAPTPTGTATPTPTTPPPTPGATPTPTPTAGPSTAVPPVATPTGLSMLDVKSATSFKAIGALHSLQTSDTGELYAGNAATTAAPNGTISYDPRDGIFTLALSDEKANVTREMRFQDPAHRTDFEAAGIPDPTVINLTAYNYLVAADSGGSTYLFYQRPGNRTNYVTLAGFVHSSEGRDERGALAFGAETPLAQIPRSGGGRYVGDFLATMVSRDLDATTRDDTRFQWINGESTIDVDFAKSMVGVQLVGVTSVAHDADRDVIADSQLMVPAGTGFSAAATATIDMIKGGFAGKFLSAGFTGPGGSVPIDFASVSTGSSTAGASSIDGSFYGAGAVEIGGSFRITGGIPDQRVDILGGFTGRKK